MGLKCLFGHKWNGFQCERCNINCKLLDFFTSEEREVIQKTLSYIQRNYKEYRDVMNAVAYKVTTNAVIDIQYVVIIRTSIDLRFQEYMMKHENPLPADEEWLKKLLGLRDKIIEAESKYSDKH